MIRHQVPLSPLLLRIEFSDQKSGVDPTTMYSPREIATSEQDLRERFSEIWLTRTDVIAGGSLSMELRLSSSR